MQQSMFKTAAFPSKPKSPQFSSDSVCLGLFISIRKNLLTQALHDEQAFIFRSIRRKLQAGIAKLGDGKAFAP